MFKGINRITILLLFPCLYLLATNASGQKVYKDNFIKIANAYLEYTCSNPYEKFTHYKLTQDTGSTIYFASTFFNYDSSHFFYQITFRDANVLTDLKYKQVYSLGNFKLLIPEGLDQLGALTNLFKKRQYEDLNKGKPISGNFENIQKWYFLMNKKYEIVEAHGGFLTQKELIEILNKRKVRFAKYFRLMPE